MNKKIIENNVVLVFVYVISSISILFILSLIFFAHQASAQQIVFMTAIPANNSWCITEYKDILQTYTKMRREDIGRKFEREVDQIDRLHEYEALINRLHNIQDVCTFGKIAASALLFRATIAEEAFEQDMLALAYLRNVYSVYYKDAKRYYGFPYPEIGEDTLFKIMKLEHKAGYCTQFMNDYAEFQKQFPKGREQYKEMIADYKDDCEERQQEINENIKLVYGSEAPQKVDIVVLGHGFLDYEELEQYVQEHFIKGIFFVQEWEALANQENKDKFNIYIYKEILEDECKTPKDIAEKNLEVCSCNTDIQRIANMVGADNFFVLMNGEPNTFCRSNARFGLGARIFISEPAPDNPTGRLGMVLPKKQQPPYYYDEQGNIIFATGNDKYDVFNYNELVILHESGHSLWLLSDEYVEYQGRDDPDKPNCANTTADADAWWSEITYSGPELSLLHPIIRNANMLGRFDGCSLTKDNIRPIYNSIMNDHTYFSIANQKGSFGPVNDWQISNILTGYR